MASSTRPTFCTAVRTSTRGLGSSSAARKPRRKPNPSSPFIMRSRMTRSGWNSISFFRPERPSMATSTMKPLSSKNGRRKSETSSSSSTIMTRLLTLGSPFRRPRQQDVGAPTLDRELLQALARARAGHAEAAGGLEHGAVGAAEQVAAVVGVELVVAVIEREAGVGAAVQVGPQLAAVVHQEALARETVELDRELGR